MALLTFFDTSSILLFSFFYLAGSFELHCPLGKSTLTIHSNKRYWTVTYDEYPGSYRYFSSDNDAVTDPCLQLLNGRNLKNRHISLLEGAELARSVCTARCVRSVNIDNIDCGPRRPPPKWSAGAKFDRSEMIPKANCSDWNLPFDQTDWPQPVHLILQPPLTSLEEDERINPMTELKTYIKKLNIEKLTLSSEDALDSRVINKVLPEVLSVQEKPFSHLRLEGNRVSRRRTLQAIENISPLLASLPTLRGLVMEKFNITGRFKPSLPDPAIIQYIIFHMVEMNEMPSWLSETSQLLYLYIESIDYTDMGATVSELPSLDRLPALEFLTLHNMAFQTLPPNFLAASSRLRLLDLSCNRLLSLPENALAHLTQLQVLSVAGNHLETLWENSLSGLGQLKIVDLRQAIPRRDKSVIYEMEFPHVNHYKYCHHPTYDNWQTDGLKQLNASHLQHSPLLQRVELGNNVHIQLHQDTFRNLSLRHLDLQNTGIKDLNGLKLDTMCQLAYLRVSGNDFSHSNWISMQTAINLQKMRRFIVSNSNITQITAPLYMLSEMDQNLQGFVSEDLTNSDNPAGEDSCQRAIWGSLLRNERWQMADQESRCDSQLGQIEQKLALWQPQISSARCYQPAIGEKINSATSPLSSIISIVFFLFSIVYFL